MWIPQSVVPISLLLIVVMSLFRIVIQATGTGSDVKDNRGQV
jgi:hypothetical protein